MKPAPLRRGQGRKHYQNIFDMIWQNYQELHSCYGYPRSHLYVERTVGLPGGYNRVLVSDWMLDIWYAIKASGLDPYEFDPTDPDTQVRLGREFARRKLLPREYWRLSK